MALKAFIAALSRPPTTLLDMRKPCGLFFQLQSCPQAAWHGWTAVRGSAIHFMAKWDVPHRQPCHAQEGLEEAETFCKMMVTNTIEDLLEPSKRMQLPCGFNYKRLALILAKYRYQLVSISKASSIRCLLPCGLSRCQVYCNTTPQRVAFTTSGAHAGRLATRHHT